MEWPDGQNFSVSSFGLNIFFLVVPAFMGIFLVYIDFGNGSRYINYFWGDVFGFPWYFMDIFIDYRKKEIAMLGMIIFPVVFIIIINLLFMCIINTKNNLIKWAFWIFLSLSLLVVGPLDMLSHHYWWLAPHYVLFVSYW